MAEGTLTLKKIINTGLNPAGVAPTITDGDGFVNNGNVFIQVVNGNAGAVIVTIDAYPTGNQTPKPDDLTVTDRTVSIPAGETRLIGPFPPSIYNRPADGKVKVTCDVVALTTIAAIYMLPNAN